SGGLDSSLLLALMTKTRSEPIDTFTIRFRRHDQKYEQMPEDSGYARVVADAFRSRHTEIEIDPHIVHLLPTIIWHMDEPRAYPAAINTFLLCRTAREHGITVILNGMGADEIFGGYRTYRACMLAGHYQDFLPRYGQMFIRRVVDGFPVATSNRGFRG